MVTVPIRYSLEVSPSLYDQIKKGQLKEYSYSTTDHLPREPRTAKDNPHNIANLLRRVQVDDSLIFECDKHRLKTMLLPMSALYTNDLEVKVKEIKVDENIHQRTIVFDSIREI